MDAVTLSGRVEQKDGAFEATVSNLPISGSGETVEEAQQDLVDRLIGWIQAREGQENLEEKLAEAGYPGVDEETELVLEFVE